MSRPRGVREQLKQAGVWAADTVRLHGLEGNEMEWEGVGDCVVFTRQVRLICKRSILTMPLR